MPELSSTFFAVAVTGAAAFVALVAGAVDARGAVAGFVIGYLVSVSLGLPGLAVLGAFFVLGSLATRIGWRRKTAEGTAESGEGARGAKRVVGKGLIAALGALLPAPYGPLALSGAVAAALGDTLGTEVGTLSRGATLRLGTFERVPPGTPGAVSLLGTLAALGGAVLIAAVARWALDLGVVETAGVCVGGWLAPFVESAGRRGTAPGWVWNLVTTACGAVLAVVPVLAGWSATG